jgi:hypothetical protein
MANKNRGTRAHGAPAGPGSTHSHAVADVQSGDTRPGEPVAPVPQEVADKATMADSGYIIPAGAGVAVESPGAGFTKRSRWTDRGSECAQRFLRSRGGLADVAWRPFEIQFGPGDKRRAANLEAAGKGIDGPGGLVEVWPKEWRLNDDGTDSDRPLVVVKHASDNPVRLMAAVFAGVAMTQAPYDKKKKAEGGGGVNLAKAKAILSEMGFASGFKEGVALPVGRIDSAVMDPKLREVVMEAIEECAGEWEPLAYGAGAPKRTGQGGRKRADRYQCVGKLNAKHVAALLRSMAAHGRKSSETDAKPPGVYLRAMLGVANAEEAPGLQCQYIEEVTPKRADYFLAGGVEKPADALRCPIHGAAGFDLVEKRTTPADARAKQRAQRREGEEPTPEEIAEGEEAAERYAEEADSME